VISGADSRDVALAAIPPELRTLHDWLDTWQTPPRVDTVTAIELSPAEG